jgi:endonuclease/exonuclease/phosphatase family metal-dependent hydrolase
MRCPSYRVLLLIAAASTFFLAGCGGDTTDAPPPILAEDSYQFCFWNVENLFDDQDDHRTQPGDREFDSWFAHDPKALKLKLDNLSDALIKMNGGKGPDILAIAEVESVRAAELLRQALNGRLKKPELHYQHLLMKDLNAGRHIAPAILTRLPVLRDKTRLHGRHLRILEGHVTVNGHDLVVLATHWTSRLTDKEGEHRGKYGDEIYGIFRGMYKSNPNVDLLVCGDFNDPPEAPSVTEHLHATGDQAAVLADGNRPLLLDLFADKDPLRYGTHNFRNKWFIFDHIVISPGLLDRQGWTCEVSTVKTMNSLVRPNDNHKHPWRFGNEHDKFIRGYSDHFPVTVRLEVEDK